MPEPSGLLPTIQWHLPIHDDRPKLICSGSGEWPIWTETIDVQDGVNTIAGAHTLKAKVDGRGRYCIQELKSLYKGRLELVSERPVVVGAIDVGGDCCIRAPSIINQGLVNSRGVVELESAGLLDNRKGQVRAANVTIVAQKTLNQHGRIFASERANVRSGELSNESGLICGKRGTTVRIQEQQAPSWDVRLQWIKRESPEAWNGVLDNREGQILSAGELDVHSSGVLLNDGGHLHCDGRATIHSDALVSMEEEGEILVGGELKFTTAGPILIKEGAQVCAGASAAIHSQGEVRLEGSGVSAGQRLEVVGKRVIVAGRVQGEELLLESTEGEVAIKDTGGLLYGSQLTIRSHQAMRCWGSVAGQGAASISADTLTFSDGGMVTNGPVQLEGNKGIWVLDGSHIEGQRLSLASKGRLFHQGHLRAGEEIAVEAQSLTDQGTTEALRATYRLGTTPNRHIEELVKGNKNPYVHRVPSSRTQQEWLAAQQAAEKARAAAAEAAREVRVRFTPENVAKAEAAAKEEIHATRVTFCAHVRHCEAVEREVSARLAEAEVQVQQAQETFSQEASEENQKRVQEAETQVQELQIRSERVSSDAQKARQAFRQYREEHCDTQKEEAEDQEAHDSLEGSFLVQGGRIRAREVYVHAGGEASISDHGLLAAEHVELHVPGRVFVTDHGVVNGCSLTVVSEQGSLYIADAGRVESLKKQSICAAQRVMVSQGGVLESEGGMTLRVTQEPGAIMTAEGGRITAQKGPLEIDARILWQSQGRIYAQGGLQFSERIEAVISDANSEIGSMSPLSFPPGCLNNQGLLWSSGDVHFQDFPDLREGRWVGDKLCIHVDGNFVLDQIPSTIDCAALVIEVTGDVYSVTQREFPYGLELRGRRFIVSAPLTMNGPSSLDFPQGIELTCVDEDVFFSRQEPEFVNAPRRPSDRAPVMRETHRRERINIMPEKQHHEWNSQGPRYEVGGSSVHTCLAWDEPKRDSSFLLHFVYGTDVTEPKIPETCGEMIAHHGLTIKTGLLNLLRGKLLIQGPAEILADRILGGDRAYCGRDPNDHVRPLEGDFDLDPREFTVESITGFASPRERDRLRDLPYPQAPCVHYSKQDERSCWGDTTYTGRWVQPTAASQQNLIAIRGPLRLRTKCLELNGGSFVAEGHSEVHIEGRLTVFGAQMLFLGDTRIETGQISVCFAPSTEGQRPATINAVGGRLELFLQEGHCWSSHLSATDGVFVNGVCIDPEALPVPPAVRDQGELGHRGTPRTDALWHENRAGAAALRDCALQFATWPSSLVFYGKPVPPPGYEISNRSLPDQGSWYFSGDSRSPPRMTVSSETCLVLSSGRICTINATLATQQAVLDAIQQVTHECWSMISPPRPPAPEQASLLDYADLNHPLFQVTPDGSYVWEPRIPFQFGGDLPPPVVMGCPCPETRPFFSPVQELMALIRFLQTHTGRSQIPGESREPLHAMRENARDSGATGPKIVYEEMTFQGQRGLGPVLLQASQLSEEPTPGMILAERLLHVITPQLQVSADVRTPVLVLLAGAVDQFSTIVLRAAPTAAYPAVDIPPVRVEVGRLIADRVASLSMEGAALIAEEVTGLESTAVELEPSTALTPDPATGGEKVVTREALLQLDDGHLQVASLQVAGSRVVAKQSLQVEASQRISAQEKAIRYVAEDTRSLGGLFGLDQHTLITSVEVQPATLQSQTGDTILKAPSIHGSGSTIQAAQDIRIQGADVELATTFYSVEVHTESSGLRGLSYEAREEHASLPIPALMEIRAGRDAWIEGPGEGTLREVGLQVQAGRHIQAEGFAAIDTQAAITTAEMQQSGWSVGITASVQVPVAERLRELAQEKTSSDILAEAIYTGIAGTDCLQGAPLVQVGAQIGWTSFDQSRAQQVAIPTQYQAEGSIGRIATRTQTVDGGFKGTAAHGDITLSAGERLLGRPAILEHRQESSQTGLALTSILPFQTVGVHVQHAEQESIAYRVRRGALEAREGTASITAPLTELDLSVESKRIVLGGGRAMLSSAQEHQTSHSSAIGLSTSLPFDCTTGGKSFRVENKLESTTSHGTPATWQADEIDLRVAALHQQGTILQAPTIRHEAVREQTTSVAEEQNERSGVRLAAQLQPSSVAPMVFDVALQTSSSEGRLVLPLGRSLTSRIFDRGVVPLGGLSSSLHPEEEERSIARREPVHAGQSVGKSATSSKTPGTPAPTGPAPLRIRTRKQLASTCPSPKAGVSKATTSASVVEHPLEPDRDHPGSRLARALPLGPAEVEPVETPERLWPSGVPPEAKRVLSTLNVMEAWTREQISYIRQWQAARQHWAQEDRIALFGAAALRLAGAALEVAGLGLHAVGITNPEHPIGRVVARAATRIGELVPERIRQWAGEMVQGISEIVAEGSHLPLSLARRAVMDGLQTTMAAAPTLRMFRAAFPDYPFLWNRAAKVTRPESSSSSGILALLGQEVPWDPQRLYYAASWKEMNQIVKQGFMESCGKRLSATPKSSIYPGVVIGVRDGAQVVERDLGLAMSDRIDLNPSKIAFIAAPGEWLGMPRFVETLVNAVGYRMPIVALEHVQAQVRQHRVRTVRPAIEEPRVAVRSVSSEGGVLGSALFGMEALPDEVLWGAGAAAAIAAGFALSKSLRKFQRIPSGHPLEPKGASAVHQPVMGVQPRPSIHLRAALELDGFEGVVAESSAHGSVSAAQQRFMYNTEGEQAILQAWKMALPEHGLATKAELRLGGFFQKAQAWPIHHERIGGEGRGSLHGNLLYREFSDQSGMVLLRAKAHPFGPAGLANKEGRWFTWTPGATAEERLGRLWQSMTELAQEKCWSRIYVAYDPKRHHLASLLHGAQHRITALSSLSQGAAVEPLQLLEIELGPALM